jgi:hypothetical protein
MIDLSNENIVHQKKENIEYLQFRKLQEYPEIVHCYTLKAHDFDISGNSSYKENTKRVYENYKKLANALNIKEETIIRPYQTHTSIVKNVDRTFIKNDISIFPKELTNVDGLLTNEYDITFSLGFADCTPIYLYDPVKNVIGNIHSGWRGTLQRIGKIAVEKMIIDYGCNPKDIICCIGPCIQKCHFEVKQDVADLFFNEFKDIKNIDEIISYNGIKENEKRYLVDTTKINKYMMGQLGLKENNIIDSGICTACNSKYMHSYRIDKENAGRNTAILGLRRKLI